MRWPRCRFGHRHIGAAVLGVCLVTAAACGRTSPVSPDDPFSGTWSGAIQDTTSGAGTLELTLHASSSTSDIGSFAMTWANGARSGGDASIDARVAPTSTILLTCKQTSSSGGVTGSLTSLVKTALTATISDAGLTGNYTFGCGGFHQGTFSLTRTK